MTDAAVERWNCSMMGAMDWPKYLLKSNSAGGMILKSDCSYTLLTCVICSIAGVTERANCWLMQSTLGVIDFAIVS